MGLVEPQATVCSFELLFYVGGRVGDVIGCDLDLVEDTPGVIPLGELRGERWLPGPEVLWRQVGSCRAAEVGHIAGEAVDTRYVGGVGTQFCAGG